MTEGHLFQIATGALLLTVKLAAPILIASLLIGLVVSIFQSVTQIQEVTLTFVPKLVGIALVLLLTGSWMLSQMITYVHQLYGQTASLLGG